MAESLTKQDEKNPVIWLTNRLRSSHTGLTRKNFFWPYNKTFIDQGCTVKTALFLFTFSRT